MPNLPKNLVKPPMFDNPLRRTARAEVDAEPAPSAIAPPSTPPHHELTVDETLSGQESSGIIIPFANSRADGSPEPTATRPDPTPAETCHRITVRIDDTTRCALESECHRRRIAGEKTNVAEIARGILVNWVQRVE